MWQYLVDAFSGPGAVFMYAIVAVGAYAVAVALERTFWLYGRWRPDIAAITSAIDAGDDARAVAASGDTPMGDVVRAGTTESTPEAGWEAMRAAGVLAEDAVMARVGHLSAVGAISTMLGLLGTVWGLAIAFGALGDTSAGERAVGLSEGIATAMATTAAGLVVGIFALAVHAALSARARTLLVGIEFAAGRIALRLRKSQE